MTSLPAVALAKAPLAATVIVRLESEGCLFHLVLFDETAIKEVDTRAQKGVRRILLSDAIMMPSREMLCYLLNPLARVRTLVEPSPRLELHSCGTPT